MDEELKSDLLVSKLANISASVDKINKFIPDISERTADSELQNGLSLMQLKNTILMVHNANLLHLISKKLKGEPIKDSSTVDRLIESRVLMERMKPLEVKLKYQMERLLKLTTITDSQDGNSLTNNSGKGATEKALNFKPNLANLMKKTRPDIAASEIDDDDEDLNSDSDQNFDGDDGEDVNIGDDEERLSESFDEEINGANSSGVQQAVRQSTSRNRAGLERAKEHLRQKKVEKSGGKYIPPKLVPMPYNHG